MYDRLSHNSTPSRAVPATAAPVFAGAINCTYASIAQAMCCYMPCALTSAAGPELLTGT